MHSKGQKPKPTGFAVEQIRSLAEMVSDRLDYKPDTQSLYKIIKKLGGEIVSIDGNDAINKSSYIKVSKNNTFSIFLSCGNFPLRERYTIAHELGHFVLHSRCGQVPIVANHSDNSEDDLSDGAEFEAHEFACAFLVPQKYLSKVILENGRDPLTVAAYFLVPLPIAQKRINDLNKKELRL